MSMPEHPDSKTMVRPTKTIELGIANYTEFGTLTKVEEVGSYVRIYNQTGWYADMKKVYTNWARVMLKAKDLIDRPIVIETGITSSPTDYFRNLCEDDHFGKLLSIPDDAGPHATAVIVATRFNSANKSYHLKKAIENAAAEEKRWAELQARMEKEDQETVDHATKLLNKEWPKFLQYPDREFIVGGAGWKKSNTPGNIDKKIALRLGIDTTKKKRIRVKVLDRGRNNYVKVQLTNYDNAICNLAIKPSDVASTKGEWGIASVDPDIPGWWDMEKKHYPDCKTFVKPIEWFLERNQELLSLVTKAA